MTGQEVFLVWRENWADRPKPTPLIRNVWCYGDIGSAGIMARHIDADRYGDNPKHTPGLIYRATEGDTAADWQPVNRSVILM